MDEIEREEIVIPTDGGKEKEAGGRKRGRDRAGAGDIVSRYRKLEGQLAALRLACALLLAALAFTVFADAINPVLAESRRIAVQAQNCLDELQICLVFLPTTKGISVRIRNFTIVSDKFLHPQTLFSSTLSSTCSLYPPCIALP